jgi:hypothetical protein
LLGRPLEEVKLSEVTQLLEGSIVPAECVNNPGICSRSKSCVTRDIWGELKQAVGGILKSTTLQDLAERQGRKAQIEEVVYHICLSWPIIMMGHRLGAKYQLFNMLPNIETVMDRSLEKHGMIWTTEGANKLLKLKNVVV